MKERKDAGQVLEQAKQSREQSREAEQLRESACVVQVVKYKKGFVDHLRTGIRIYLADWYESMLTGHVGQNTGAHPWLSPQPRRFSSNGSAHLRRFVTSFKCPTR
jgi:hypothetical protein